MYYKNSYMKCCERKKGSIRTFSSISPAIHQMLETSRSSILLQKQSPFPLIRARSKGCFCFGNSKTISSGPYSSLPTSLVAFFCSPNLRGKLLLFFCFFSKWKVCFFAHQNAKPLPFEALLSPVL